MDKLIEKKNFGIPSSILCIIAYVLGFNVANLSVYVLLPLFIFVTAVFAFNFEDRVVIALKQSLVFGFIAYIIGLCLSAYDNLIILIRPLDYSSYSAEGLHYVLAKISVICANVLDIAVIVVFAVLILSALLHKDVKIRAFSNVSLDTPETCPKCGTQNQGGVAFCAKCGASMK